MQSGLQLELDFPPLKTTFKFKKTQVFPIKRLRTKPGHHHRKIVVTRIENETGNHSFLTYETLVLALKMQTTETINDAAKRELIMFMCQYLLDASNDS